MSLSSLRDQERELPLDALRGCAILAVLVLHAVVLAEVDWAGTPPGKFVQRLSFGIPLFFVISGYVITGSWDRCVQRGEGRRGFLLRRAAKIVPLYLLFVHAWLAYYAIVSAYAPEVPALRNTPTAESVTLTD